MPPYSNWVPSKDSKLLEAAPISFAIGIDFPLPIFGKPFLPLGKAVTVPEISIDENSNLGCSKYDAGSAGLVFNDGHGVVGRKVSERWRDFEFLSVMSTSVTMPGFRRISPDRRSQPASTDAAPFFLFGRPKRHDGDKIKW